MRTLFGIILALFCTATFLEAKDMNALSTNERNLAAIAANNGIDCNELTKASNGLKASISTMHDNISAIYESYSVLSGALSEFLLRLPEDPEAVERMKDYLTAHGIYCKEEPLNE